MGSDIEAARLCFASTARRSIQHIAANDFPRFLHVQKPADDASDKPAAKKRGRVKGEKTYRAPTTFLIRPSAGRSGIFISKSFVLTAWSKRLPSRQRMNSVLIALSKRQTKRGRNDPAPSRLAAEPARHQAHGYRAYILHRPPSRGARRTAICVWWVASSRRYLIWKAALLPA